MARPSRAGGKRSAAKTRKSTAVTKTLPPKAPSKKAARTKSFLTDLKKQIERQARELEEARQQQAASSRVLHIIGASPGALKPVFQAIVKNAVELCGARFGAVFKMEGDLLHLLADYSLGAAHRQLFEAMYPMTPNRGHISGRAILMRSTVQIPDVNADKDYAGADAKQSGFRSLLATPLLKGAQAIGSIVIYKAEPGIFPPRQIALLQNFAAQAVIAIGNARLFNETKEALERQTVIAEVLEVINASPGDLDRVFEVMLERAMRLCEAAFGGFTSYDGTRFHTLALRGLPPEVAQAFGEPWTAGPGSYHENLVQGESLVHTDLLKLDDAARRAHPQSSAVSEIGGARTGLFVALRKEEKLVGSLWFYRKEVRPFSDEQIALVQNFAAQSVIAMENARLLNELRQRTNDLSESLQQQTATA